jgi:hypothetical protein
MAWRPRRGGTAAASTAFVAWVRESVHFAMKKYSLTPGNANIAASLSLRRFLEV